MYLGQDSEKEGDQVEARRAVCPASTPHQKVSQQINHNVHELHQCLPYHNLQRVTNQLELHFHLANLRQISLLAHLNLELCREESPGKHSFSLAKLT